MRGLTSSLRAIFFTSSPAAETAVVAAPAVHSAAPIAAAAKHIDPAPAAQRFAFVDALRGIAAMSVCLHHIFRYGPLPAPDAAGKLVPQPLMAVFANGKIGVQMFFVISGFVIAYVLRKTTITSNQLRSFGIQRFLRLGPPYWFTIVFVLALYSLTHSLAFVASPLIDDPPTLGQVGAHLFYLQNLLGMNNLSAGFWTLCIEMQFYLLFALLLGTAQWLSVRTDGGSSRSFARSLTVVFLPLALASLFWLSRDDGATENWVIHFFHYFFLGALVWWTLDGRTPKALFWAYIALFAVRIGLQYELRLVVGISAGLAVYAAGRLGRLGDWLNFPWLQNLGRVSYSLYLVHYPISWIVGTLGFLLTGASPYWALGWLVLSVVVSVKVAGVMHEAVEVPAIRLAQRFKEWDQRPPGVPVRTAPEPSAQPIPAPILP